MNLSLTQVISELFFLFSFLFYIIILSQQLLRNIQKKFYSFINWLLNSDHFINTIRNSQLDAVLCIIILLRKVINYMHLDK